MFFTTLTDYPQPLHGLLEGARADLVAVCDDHSTALAIAETAERPVVVEWPHANQYGLYRVFTLATPQRARLPR